jgi:hypothetical protein
MDYTFQNKSTEISVEHIKQLEDKYNQFNDISFIQQMNNINQDKRGKVIDNTYLTYKYINKKTCFNGYEMDGEWVNSFKNTNNFLETDRQIFNKNTRQKTI